MVQSMKSGWTDQLAEAEAFDESLADRSKSWVPPILTALVTAASRTGLVRLYPFTSVNRLRFATSALWYAGDGDVAPVFITLQPDPDGYGVYTVEQHGAFELVLETEDPIVAVARVEELLAGWPGDVHLATT